MEKRTVISQQTKQSAKENQTLVWDNLHAGGQLQIVKNQFITALFNINSVLLRWLQKEIRFKFLSSNHR